MYAATREFNRTTPLSPNRWKFKRVTGIMQTGDKEKPGLDAKTLGRYRILGELEVRGRIPAAAVTEMADELARYALGVDSDFAKRLTAV